MPCFGLSSKCHHGIPISCIFLQSLHCKVKIRSTSWLVAHSRVFRLIMKGKQALFFFLVHPSQLEFFQNSCSFIWAPGLRNFPKMSTAVLVYLEPHSSTVCQRSIVYNLNRLFDILSTLEYQTKPKLSIQCAHQGSHHCIHCTSCT